MEMIQATSCSKVVVKPFSASSKSAALGHGLTAFLIRRIARAISKGFFAMGLPPSLNTTKSEDPLLVLSCCGMEKDKPIIPTGFSSAIYDIAVVFCVVREWAFE